MRAALPLLAILALGLAVYLMNRPSDAPVGTNNASPTTPLLIASKPTADAPPSARAPASRPVLKSPAGVPLDTEQQERWDAIENDHQNRPLGDSRWRTESASKLTNAFVTLGDAMRSNAQFQRYSPNSIAVDCRDGSCLARFDMPSFPDAMAFTEMFVQGRLEREVNVPFEFDCPMSLSAIPIQEDRSAPARLLMHFDCEKAKRHAP